MANRVIVLGSGAAGLSAAVSAAQAGASVTVLESASTLGGTTAISGGGIWIPANPWGAARGVKDSAEDALRYLKALELGDSDATLAGAYVARGLEAALAIEDHTPLRWQHLSGFSDYHAEFDGGKALGRSLEVAPVQVPLDALAQIRDDPHRTGPITIMEEATGSQPDAAEIARRERDGIVTRGRGLIAGLLAALHELGGGVRAGVRAARLITANGAVVGVEAGGAQLAGQVVIASGGFERDPLLVRSFLRGPLLAPAGPPSNRGDGLRMGMAVGAALGNMSEAWWAPAMELPGQTIDGAPLYRMLFMDLAAPGGVAVDSTGRRFANEATNYNDLGRSMYSFDAANYSYPGIPSWLVFDAVRRNAPLGPLGAGDPDPAWLQCAATIEALAERIGVPPDALASTIERFNACAARGVDDDFGRGSYAWDRVSGGTAELRPVAEPPFYALKVLAGCLGTKGGLRTDAHGRVLSVASGEAIPGLYAAGNAAANLFGCGYPGPGATIGPAVVFGWFAGQAAAASG
jgi:succinate dehydrogenase/fumarate reductase flavoprotein subunit